MESALVIAIAKAELRKHRQRAFVNNPPSIAEGGSGVVVPGCAFCKKRLNTGRQFLEHLAKDVLPNIIRDAATNLGVVIANMDDVIAAAQKELRKHDWDVFMTEPSAGERVRVAGHGCIECRKDIGSDDEFMDHLADDVLQKILETLPPA